MKYIDDCKNLHFTRYLEKKHFTIKKTLYPYMLSLSYTHTTYQMFVH